MNQQQKRSGGTKKHGRNKAHCRLYLLSNRRQAHKLQAILQSNGKQAAQAYLSWARFGRPKGFAMPRES